MVLMSVLFNGSTQYAEDTSISGIPANNANQSMVVRFMPTATPSGNNQIIGLSNAGASSAIQFGFRDNVFLVWGYGGLTFVSSGGSLSINTWHTGIYTYDGTTHRLYVDGGTPYTDTASPQTGTPNLIQVGAYIPGEYFTGILGQWRLYNRQLSDTEAACIANMGGRDRIFNGRVGLWQMDEAAPGVAASGSDSILDVVGGNDLTPANSPSYDVMFGAARRRRAA